MATEGYINVQAPLIPNNDNPRGYTTDNKYVKGAPQVFYSVQEMVAFHPVRMKSGMTATILNWPSAGTITDFRLNADPPTLLNSLNESVVTLDNFQEFWIVISQLAVPKNRVYQYAPDGPGGGTPTFPYTVGTEHVWSNIRDDAKGHRWTRFRDDDVDANSDGIYDNWSVPLSIGTAFITGDYIENRFKRQAVDTSIHNSSATLALDKYYMVQSGTITITGANLEACEIGEYGSTTTAILTSGRTFKYVAGNTYTFNAATAEEIVKTPPRSIGGVPNNEPAGWEDTIPTLPAGEQLWQISAQKSVYGQLKTDWILKKIAEDPNFIRYSMNPSPHPDTIAGPNDNAGIDPTDTLLTNAGWSSVYGGESFIARREIDPGPNLYTPWMIEKISEESGEYLDHVYKLFDLNLDQDSAAIDKPTLRDPSQEGWSDTPQKETDTQINYVSQARKFFNGELKTPWSDPVPYTGQDVFIDTIDTDLGDNFKYDSDGVTVWPDQITLTAKLFKGISKLWENPDLTIVYEWKRVYNDGDPDTTIAGSSSGDPFYYLPADAEYRLGQRLVVKASGIDGTGIFRVRQILTLSPGNDIEFEEEISLLDVTDGKDAKSFDVKADSQRVIYNSASGGSFVPAEVVLRAYWANFVPAALYWYRWNGTGWTAINSDPTYVISGNTLHAASSALFSTGSGSEEITYAVSSHPTDPDSADFETHFSDYVTIGKLSSIGVGAPGEDAILALLTNESHTLVLDTLTGLPQTGQLGLAYTNVEVYKGETKLIYLTDYTIGLYTEHLPGINPVTFGLSAFAGDAQIAVTAWGAFEKSAVCSITINISGGVSILKQFAVTSTKDAPGTLILDLDSDKGFIFDSKDSSNKILTARLYIGDPTGTNAFPLPNGAVYEFRFKVANVWGTWAAANTKTITRSNILVSGEVTSEVRRTGEINAFAARTVKFTDILDGKTYRAFSQAIVLPTTGNYLTNQNPTTVFGASPGFSTGVTTGVNTWYVQASSFWTTNPNTQVFEQEAEEYIDTDNTAKWRWSTPKQIKGEAGSQGPNGNFLFPMYKALVPVVVTDPNDVAYTTPPSFGAGGNVSTLAEMKAAGWVSKIPSTGVIWEISRQWIGQGVTFDGVTGDPSTGPVSATAVWNPPIRRSGGAGIKGGPGDLGLPGPGYDAVNFAGVDPSGGNIYNLHAINGAAAAQIIAPKGTQGVAGADAIAGIYGSPGGSSIVGATVVLAGNTTASIDMGNALSKKVNLMGVAQLSGGGSGSAILKLLASDNNSTWILIKQSNITTVPLVRDYTVSSFGLSSFYRYFKFNVIPANGAVVVEYGLGVEKCVN